MCKMYLCCWIVQFVRFCVRSPQCWMENRSWWQTSRHRHLFFFVRQRKGKVSKCNRGEKQNDDGRGRIDQCPRQNFFLLFFLLSKSKKIEKKFFFFFMASQSRSSKTISFDLVLRFQLWRRLKGKITSPRCENAVWCHLHTICSGNFTFTGRKKSNPWKIDENPWKKNFEFRWIALSFTRQVSNVYGLKANGG